VTLGLLASGSARANDATQVIYDLSELQTHRVAAPTAREADHVGLPTNSLPISTPSLDGRSDGGSGDVSGDDLELRDNHRHAGRHLGNGVGAPRQGGNTNATPNPEPGTMLLLGSALATGLRFARRRSCLRRVNVLSPRPSDSGPSPAVPPRSLPSPPTPGSYC
jgi:hypothetical protein